MGSRADLAIAKRMAPATVAAYEAVEADLHDAFQYQRPLSLISPAPGPTGFDVRWTTCPDCGSPVLAGTRDPRRYCPAHAPTGPWRHLPAAAAPPCAEQDTLLDMPEAA
ncbi:hypothetical protein [Catenuloplanes atrovinosus]|uniref:Uncharacterized protein n=1 Tax=Catenuloplanes atrovinosus TaxID=137266 RepID=A0AAE4CDJ7_9ACTN|nr:hypothetical protein [Catenuloplanes atrovinosus]MDR7277590.1 hypothetical protein [Catenuloplanes atrovinosus]